MSNLLTGGIVVPNAHRFTETTTHTTGVSSIHNNTHTHAQQLHHYQQRHQQHLQQQRNGINHDNDNDNNDIFDDTDANDQQVHIQHSLTDDAHHDVDDAANHNLGAEAVADAPPVAVAVAAAVPVPVPVAAVAPPPAVDASVGMTGPLSADVILADDTHRIARAFVDVGVTVAPRVSGQPRSSVLLSIIKTYEPYRSFTTPKILSSLPPTYPLELVQMILMYTVPLMELAVWHEVRCQWPEAFDAYKLASDIEDNGIAHGKVATCYIFGLFAVRVDPSMGYIMAKRGAARGDHESLSLVARSYWHGQGAPKIDRAKSATLYTQGNDIYSRLEYGHLLLHGDPRVPNIMVNAKRGHTIIKPAFNELLQRCQRDDPRALHTLGLIYARGKCGYTVDWAKAEGLYQRAAALGNARSQGNLALTLRDNYETKVAESLQWDRYAMAQGDLEAMCNYGHSDQDHPARACELFRRAAVAGSHLGMYNLGACAYHGIGGLPEDRELARSWWLKGAEMGETDCINALNTL